MAARLGKYRVIGVVVMLVIGTTSACSSARSPRASSSALGDDAITVASFNFPESELLADIYGIALRNGGYDVRTARALGTRELVDPALARGLVELVPEYAGTALQFLSLGRVRSTPDIAGTHAALKRTLRGTNVAALDSAPGQDANAIAVTPETAAKYELRTISDLEPVAGRLTFGGPPECPSRPLCLAGLEKTYGLRFQAFLPLDAGGPVTRQAIERSEIDVALVFSTEPWLGNGSLIALEDDRSLQPAENVTPLVHRSVVKRWGQPLVDLVNRVSSRLTTEQLRSLNARVADGDPSTAVASAWLAREGLQ